MTAVTARAAGVKCVWVASPNPTPVTLAAAGIAGADGLLAIGGVQAIAALARGLAAGARCDMIVGPGNRFVTAAKLLLSAEVGIDMLAGPSELVILADDSADPSLIAADLLAQAEHDDDAIPILVTPHHDCAHQVEIELQRQLESLPTRSTALNALQNGGLILADHIEDAIQICNEFAPEHLQLMTRDPRRIAMQIENAGAVFIGSDSAEVFGDYGAGPNHVLPTGGTARFAPVCRYSLFLRARTWIRIDEPRTSDGLVANCASLARMENLEAASARSAERHQRVADASSVSDSCDLARDASMAPALQFLNPLPGLSRQPYQGATNG